MIDPAKPELHAALKTGVNVAFICLWFVLAAAILLLSRPRPYDLFLVGLVAGSIAGALQQRAIHSRRAAFERATSLIELRRALRESAAGKASIALQWIAAFILVALWLVHEARPLLGVFSGYFSFMGARESLGLKTIVWLNKHAEQREDAA